MTQSDAGILSLVLLSVAVLLEFGNFSIVALCFVCASVVFGCLGLSSRPRGRRLPRYAPTLLILALAATSILYERLFSTQIFVLTFVVVAVAILICTIVPNTRVAIMTLALAACALVAGIVTNLRWGTAGIDVFQFQQSAAAALLRGRSPFGPLVPSPVLSSRGVPTMVLTHFPYGPIVPVLEAPFRLLGDVRLLDLIAAFVISAAVLLLARRAGTLTTAACVIMAFPLTIGMVLQSWVDIITMAGIAVWLVSFRTHPKIAVCALAIALGVKPTNLIVLVPLLCWSVRARRHVIVAASIAVVFALPFALTIGLSHFYYDVAGLQLAIPTRPDGLDIDSLLIFLGVPLLPFAVSVAAVLLTAILVTRRRLASYGDMCTAMAILSTVAFLFAKQAFFNYYYIPAVLLMFSVAGGELALDAPELIRPPVLLVRAAEMVGSWSSRIAGEKGRRRYPVADLQAKDARRVPRKAR